MDRVNVTSLSLALLFLCIALLVHTSCSASLDGEQGAEVRERVRKAAAADEASEEKQEVKQISDNPYDRPSQFKMDMYRVLTIFLFLLFALFTFFLVWRFCSVD